MGHMTQRADLLRLLRSLRCPDCLSHKIKLVVGSSGPPLASAHAECTSCGRTLEFKDGVLRALPRELAQADADNAWYYDQMSGNARSHLEKRAKSRNHKKKIALVAKHLALPNGEAGRAILELGFGTGAHAAAVLQAGHIYAGLDVSAGLLVQAGHSMSLLRNALLVHGTGRRIPFRDGVFDGVFCVATLHHLEEPNDGIKELIRVLAPGGRFCFLEPRWLYPAHLMGYLANRRVEIGSPRISPRRILRFLRQLGVQACGVEHAVYTPNRPRCFVPFYEWIDRHCEHIRMLQALSVIFCVYGTK
jgi:SAM-dependent methyltransferase